MGINGARIFEIVLEQYSNKLFLGTHCTFKINVVINF